MTLISRICTSLVLLLSLAFAREGFAASAPQALSLGGQLFTAAGLPITSANVNFRVQVYDATEACVLYSEDHLGEDLSNSGGHFNLILGSGSSRVNNVGASGVLDGLVFANAGSTNVAGCASSPLTLSPGQSRQVHVLYDLGQGYVAMTPAVPVVSSAYALVADTLNGLESSSFVQVNGTSALTQANEEYAFSLTNWPRLKALLDGTSAQYLPSTPTVPLDVNGQRITDVHDPTAAQDAATKHYADTMLGGSALDLTAVGPSLGAGSTLLWDSTANKWVAGTLSTSPTGAAGGDLTGTYPNPTIANDTIKSARIQSTGIAVNRLVITDGMTGTNLGYGECLSVGQVYAWTAAGWQCTSVSSLSPVTSVAGKTGAVTLNAADVGGLGTAALSDWGTAANQIPRLDSLARLPAVDGSQLIQVNAARIQSRAIAATAPNAGQVLGWNALSTQWEPTTPASGSVTGFATGTGLLGGPITTTGTISVDVGATANKIVQENIGAQIAQGAGSATTPSFSFVASLNTGLYSPGPGQLALTANGSPSLNIAANGNVGIGSASPAGLLDVLSGGALATNWVHIQNNVGTFNPPVTVNATGLFVGTNKSSGGAETNLAFGSSYAGSALAIAGWDGVNYSEFMRVTRTGLTGLGTAAPQAALDVMSLGTSSAVILPRDTVGNRPTGVNGMLRYNTSSNAFEGFANNAWSTIAAGSSAGTVTNIASGTGLLGGPISTSGTLSVDVGTAAGKIVQLNASAQIAHANGSVSLPSYSFAGSPNTGVYSPGAGQLALSSNGTAAVTVASNGYVGVGTNVPGARLDVAGDVRINGFGGKYGFSSNGTAYIDEANGVNITVGGTNSGSMAGRFKKADGTAIMSVLDTGLIGIGTAAPQAVLDVVSTGSASAMIVPRDIASNRPVGVNGMLRYNTSSNAFEGFANNAWSTIAAGSSAGTVTNIASGMGLLGGPITTSGTLSVDVGTAASKIVQENANAQIAQSAGTVALPSYSFAGNTSSGLFSPGANQLALAVNGTAFFNMTAGGYAGLGTSSPAQKFEVNSGSIRISQNQSTIELVTGGGGANDLYGSRWRVIDTGGTVYTSIDTKNNGVWTNDRLSYAANGNIGIGSTAPLAALDIAVIGSAASAVIVPRDTTGNRPSGVNGMLRYNTSSNAFEGYQAGGWTNLVTAGTTGQWLSNTPNIYYTAGNVGIGTNAPLSTLQVSGSGSAPVVSIGNLDTGGSGGTINFTSGFTALANPNKITSSILGQADNASGGKMTFSTSQPTSGTLIERVRIDAFGRLGIGTNNPANVLHVDGGTAPGVTVSANGAENIALGGATTNGHYSTTSVAGDAILRATSGNLILSAWSGTGSISFTSGRPDSAKMVMLNSGAFGIGSLLPKAALDVVAVGSSSAVIIPRDTTGNRPTGINGMLRYNTSSNAFEGFANNAWSTISAGSTAGTVNNIVSGTGLLGGPITTSGTLSVDVGTAANQIVQQNATAQIAQASGSASLPSYAFVGNLNSGMYSPGAGQLALVTNGTAAINILANGSVGIGTASPIFPLDVVGNIRAQGWVYANGAVSSNQAFHPQIYGCTGCPGGSIAIDGTYGPSPGNVLLASGSGKVGVGTASPMAELDVWAVGSASSIIIPRDTTANRPGGVNGMLRYNTSNNAFEGFANNAWSTLSGTGSTSFPLLAPNGTNSAPSFAFSNSPTTGMFSPGANQIAMAVNGTAALSIAPSGDVSLIKRLNFPGGGSMYASIYGNGINVETSNANTATGLVVRPNGAGTSATISVAANGYDGSNAQGVLAIDGSHIVMGAPYMPYPIDVQENGANVLRIDTIGRVGIGPGAPAAGFDINVTGTTSAMIVPRDVAGNRPTGINGMLRYNTTANAFEGYQNGAWTNLISAASGSTSFPLLASPGTTSAATPSYSFAGNVNTGLFSPAAGQVSLAANGTAALSILANGNVGIGSVSPSSLFQVGNGTSFMRVSPYWFSGGGTWIDLDTGGPSGIGSGGPGQNAWIAYTSSFGQWFSGSAVGDLNYRNASGSSINLGIDSGGGAAPLIKLSSGKTYFASGVVETGASIPFYIDAPSVIGGRLTMTAGGNLGVGTTIPQAALDVASLGSSSAMIIPRDVVGNRPTGINGMLRYNTTANAFEGYQNGAWTNLISAASGSTSFPLLASPGTASAATPSYSFIGNSNTGLFSPATNQLALATNGTTALTIAASGNVGLGTATPAATLDVNGSIRAGSSTVVTAACSSTTEGLQRYNYSSHLMEYCNGTAWQQVNAIVAGSTASAVPSGPPVGANTYAYTISANYTPDWGSVSNINSGFWPASGTSSTQPAGCVGIQGVWASTTQVITLDLGSSKTIGNVYANFNGHPAVVILGIAFSNDGTNYTTSTSLYPGVNNANFVYYFSGAVTPSVVARYVRLTNGGNVGSAWNDRDALCQFAVGP